MTKIELTSTKDITLKPAGKYCEEDIQIKQNLERRAFTPSGTQAILYPSDGHNGISEVVVYKNPTEKVIVQSSETKQTITPSEGKFIDEVEVEPIPEGYIIPSGTLEITENNTYDVTDKASVIVNVASTGGVNGLQWVCDNMKTLKNMFINYTGESLDEPLSGLDTSQVEDFSYCFSNNENLKSIPQLNTCSAKTITYMFEDCKSLDGALTLDMSNVTNGAYAFKYATLDKIKFVNMNKNAQFTNGAYMFSYLGYGSGKNITIEGLDLTYVTAMNYFIDHSTVKGEFIHPETSKCTTFSNAFAYADFTAISLDLLSATNVTDMFKGCADLVNLTLKNIKKSLTIGSGTSYGHLLTVDSLINTIKELWDFSSGSATYKLSMGTKNLEKIANVYVKLVDVTDEMTAEDQYIANKKPCVVCESTDEGAMTITEYVTSKNWQLA